jgi:hypothetical protein
VSVDNLVFVSVLSKEVLLVGEDSPPPVLSFVAENATFSLGGVLDGGSVDAWLM